MILPIRTLLIGKIRFTSDRWFECCSTDNAIKNHWNAATKRSSDQEPETVDIAYATPYTPSQTTTTFTNIQPVRALFSSPATATVKCHGADHMIFSDGGDK